MNKKFKEAKIAYPCTWHYKVIGSNFQKVEDAIDGVLSKKKYIAKKTNKSNKGSYVSVHVSLIVENEDTRNSIFMAFKQHEDIKMVL